MADDTHLSRREFLAGVSTAALIAPAAGPAAARQAGMVEFAARARELSGFDPVPRELLRGAASQLDDMEMRAFVGGRAAAREVEKTVLKALYTGMHRPARGEPERFAYSQALMYAVIEDSVNVPSYCGGVPGFWSEKPQIA